MDRKAYQEVQDYQPPTYLIKIFIMFMIKILCCTENWVINRVAVWYLDLLGL